jgi:hypothetical protein
MRQTNGFHQLRMHVPVALERDELTLHLYEAVHEPLFESICLGPGEAHHHNCKPLTGQHEAWEFTTNRILVGIGRKIALNEFSRITTVIRAVLADKAQYILVVLSKPFRNHPAVHADKSIGVGHQAELVHGDKGFHKVSFLLLRGSVPRDGGVGRNKKRSAQS